jgi:choline kinase
MLDEIKNVQLVIPLAGEGQRFKERYACPKPLINVCGEKMISLAVRTLGIEVGSSVFIIRKDHDEGGMLSSEISTLSPNSSIVSISKLTSGPCATALLSIPYLDMEKPLVIANCDQVMRWSGARFLRYCMNENYDGVVVTYHETSPKNSYARLNENGDVVEIREKNPISSVSLNGIHFWKKARYFVESANEMMRRDDKTNGEFYVAPTYNYMISSGMSVGIFHIPNEQHNAIGTIEDLEAYVRKTSSMLRGTCAG